MAVQFNEDKKIFRLDTETSTYLMGLTPEGYLGHIYYGDRLYKETENYMLRMEEPPYTPSVNKREKSSFLDSFPMEYPTGGIGDYRESCLNVRNEAGQMDGMRDPLCFPQNLQWQKSTQRTSGIFRHRGRSADSGYPL